MQKTKQTEEARKQASESMKAFFRDPENRHRRSVAMKGLLKYCMPIYLFSFICIMCMESMDCFVRILYNARIGNQYGESGITIALCPV